MVAAPATPLYKIFFTDLLTNTYLGQLPLINVTAAMSLGQPGSFTADLDLSDPRFRAAVDVSSIVVPEKTAYWIDRNGYMCAGGIVWDDDYDSSQLKYTLTGASFDSYLDVTIIDQLLVYTNTDLCSMAIDLWNKAQGGADGSNIGVAIPTAGSVLSGTVDSQSWDPSTKTTYGSAIQSLSQQVPGFDYYVSVGYDSSGNPSKRLVLGNPYVGGVTADTGLVFRKPGNIMNYRWTRAGRTSLNRVFGIGGGVGGGSLVSEYQNASQIAAGYPIVAGTAQYKNIFDQPTLDRTTAGYGAAVSSGVVTPTLYINPDSIDAPLGSFNVGDPCRVVIEPDERFPKGVDTYFRVSSISITPVQSGAHENITVALTQTVG